ncbi:MAG: ketose-bisphosphate aldolase [Corallococcus sp.]|nr:ketose-bisphosphate aldolase [Corallococcus sp.]
MALVNTDKMFQKAYREGYAIGAFNVDNVDILTAVMQGAERANSPVIVAISGRMIDDAPFVKEAATLAAQSGKIPVALHLDHGKSVDLCKRCVDEGFTSVMIDASAYDFETNVKLTAQVADYAHKYNVSVESELGVITGKEDDASIDDKYGLFTHPDDVIEFVNATGIDSLAIAIGTAHGAYKFKPDEKPQLRFDILEEIQSRLPNFPLVLHGASSVPQKVLEVFNKYGGNLPAAKGIPEDMLKLAATKAVCKINVASDLRICYLGQLRKTFEEMPDKFDIKAFANPAKQAVADLVYDRLVNVMGSANKA